MNVKKRQELLRVIELINKHPEYCERMTVKDESRYVKNKKEETNEPI